jgi:hypothetical protein
LGVHVVGESLREKADLLGDDFQLKLHLVE